jgi:type I restriction enzyme S subunit
MRLSEICEINMGQSPKSEFYNADGAGLPFLQGNRTFGDKFPTFDTWTTLITKTAEAGDVIMSVRAPVGDVNITPVKMCLGRGVCSLRHKQGEQEFLYYLMRYYAQDLANRETGTVFGSVNRNDIAALEVEVPPLPIQREIAAVLSALDGQIANNRAINHHLEQVAQAIFKSWFVDFEPFGGERPATWISGKAEDFFDISIGKTPPRKDPQWFTTNPQDIIWVSISDMGSCGIFISDSSEYLTAESVVKFNIKVVPNGTVLLSFKLTIGRVAITNGEMTTNEAIAHFKRSEDTATEYLYCYLKVFDYQSLGNTSSIAIAGGAKFANHRCADRPK